MKLSGVLFDLGGTLIARFPTSYEERNATALQQWLRDRGLAVDAHFVGALVGERRRLFQERAGSVQESPASDALSPLLTRYGAPVDPAYLAEAEMAFFAPELAAVRPLPGSLDLLRSLHHRGLALGLASNTSSHSFIVECCRRLGFAPYLDPIVSSAALGWRKPDARIFNEVLARWSIPPTAAVMVGDSLGADIAGAQKLGLRTILLTAEHGTLDVGPETKPTDEVHPDAVAADLPEVGRLLEAWS